jgi:radical SAM superfamily enzyme YgiQ (UPF0313 family)
MDSKKVLFVYPNIGTELRIPLALSILIAQVKKAGHDVRLFDPTFLVPFHSDNEVMEKLGTHKETNLKSLVGRTESLDPKKELQSIVRSYKPDLICVSLVERNFWTAKDLLDGVEAPVLVGGIMPTIAPDYCIDQDWIDYICVGEGEEAIVEFLNNGLISAPNIWSKDYASQRRSLTNLDEVPEQDWSLFDKRHLLKPFMGKVYRGGAFEFSRGCFRSCTFCVAPRLRDQAKGLGCYHRTKSPELCIREIEHKIKDYDLNMVAFGDTDFLSGVPKEKITEFLCKYHDRCKIPFTIQTSVPTLLDEDILKLLRKAQCCAISVGVESGSERIRKEVMKKIIPTDLIKKSFDLCRKHELRVTANYMIGLPYEEEADVQETIKLNRMINPPSIAVTFFTPFIGTELYDICIKEGYYKPFRENVYDYPPLDMPQLKPERIKQLVKDFTDDFHTYQQDFAIV